MAKWMPPELTHESVQIMPSSGDHHHSEAARVVWLVNSLGAGNSLLYWGEILAKYVGAFPATKVFVGAGRTRRIPGTSHDVQRLPSFTLRLGRRTNSYNRMVQILSPTVLRRVAAHQPDVLIVMEFNLLSLYAVLSRRWLRPARILLLVESQPRRCNPRLIDWFDRRLRRFICERVDLILTNNASGRRHLEDTLSVDPHKIRSSPYLASHVPGTENRRNEDRHQRHDLGDADKTVFVYVGQLIERKGVFELINGVHATPPAIRQQCRFWLVGDGDQRQRIVDRIRELGLDDVIRVLGPCRYEELWRYYVAADVFVNPTLQDYRALVGFEALQFGLPLFQSVRDGAAEEIVEKGENGFTFDPRNAAETAEGIEWFVAHANELGRLGERSAELAKLFSVETAVESLTSATRSCRGIVAK